MLADRAHAQSERRPVDQERDDRRDEQPEPEERIVESAALDVPAESRDARRIRRAREKQLEEEARDADREQIDRDADDDLIGAIADRGDGVNEREEQSAEHPTEHANPRTSRIVGAEHGAECAARA